MDTADTGDSFRYVRSRTSNACDGCKARKVKCDGNLPCSYCAGRQRAQTCHYSQQRRRRQRVSSQSLTSDTPSLPLPTSPPPSTRDSRRETQTRSQEQTPDASTRPASQMRTENGRAGTGASMDGMTHAHGRNTSTGLQLSAEASAEDETEVPREARLLCDAHGKLIFIGDCAPLSFFQSVRQLVTTRVGQNAFTPETSRYSVLESAPPQYSDSRLQARAGPPQVRPAHVAPAVSSYLSTTTSLVDLFDNEKLLGDLNFWANSTRQPDDVTSVINYLVLAIGRLMDDEQTSQVYFEFARDRAYSSLSRNLGVETVQAFALITVYMLCSCQINGAFLFFGIAVRAAYSIGVHRTEVNARFGTEVHRQRDRLWKSLRVVDLFLSISMGRPPATSDVDCTVPYRSLDAQGNEVWDLLNASVQILLITEGIVVEIYSRKKISLQLTEGVSRQLREWSLRWLHQLTETINQSDGQVDAEVIGACQVLTSYYYAVMLVSRPFLMYELFRRLSDGPSSTGSALTSGKSKLADACTDAARLMVGPIQKLIEQKVLGVRVPLIISWLFASSLVLGVGLLGGFDRALEAHTKMSIKALDQFAQNDGHAKQYSLIAQSLLTTAQEHLDKREVQERLRRTESSSQLFGLIPPNSGSMTNSPAQRRGLSSQGGSPAGMSASDRQKGALDKSFLQHHNPEGTNSPRGGDIDSAFLGLSESLLQTPDVNYWNANFGNEGDLGSALNLFPLLEASGGIDLAHYYM